MNVEPTEVTSARLPERQTLPQGWLESGIALLDGAGAVQELNPALGSWLGVNAVEHIRGQPFRAVLARLGQGWEERLPAFADLPGPFHEAELTGGRAEGRQWLKLEASRNGAGWFVRLGSVLPPLKELAESPWDQYLADGGARRELFVRMLRAEARLHNLIHHWPGVIFSQRADFSFAFVSPQIEELTGVPVEQWLVQPQRFWEVIHEADLEEVRTQVRRAGQTLQGVNSTYRIRHVRSGRVQYVLEQRQGVTTEGGMLLGYEGVWLDVTRQTIAENRLSTASWKEALGVLTMGLAHDFSNVMAGIHALSESFAAQFEPEHPCQEGLALIKSNSLQASQLVQRIIHLHHGKTGERTYQDLNGVVSDLVVLVRKVVSRRIEVVCELHAQSLPIYVDVVEFRQVIVNLTLNAADAMPHGGRLVFRTAYHPTLPPLLEVQGNLPTAPAVCLSVQDSGHGIKSKHLRLIFDPFFTTKAMNKGSGLGLYNARLFIEKHHGAISVDTAEGKGTAFHLWLPQSDFTEAERERSLACQSRHSVLVTGQTDRLVDSTAQFLRENGFHVLTAVSAERAEEVLEAEAGTVAGLLVLEEGKDERLGRFLGAVRRRRLAPKTILQVVGCNQDELDTGMLRQADAVISPDLPEEEILERIRRVLAAPEGGSA